MEPLQHCSTAVAGLVQGLVGRLDVVTTATILVGAVTAACLWVWVSSSSIPKICVDLEQAEASDDGLQGPCGCTMQLKDPKRPGYVQCFDPCTLQRLGEVKAMTAQDVEDIVQRARIAQRQWASTSFKERRRVLNCLQAYLLAHQEDICRVASRDSGKPKVDALLGEVLTTTEKIRCICALGESWLRPERRPPGPVLVYKRAQVEFHPLGVLGVIAPWNYPFHNVMNHVISGIFAGNAVVSKVSEYTSWSSRYFGAIVSEALRACGHSPDLVAIVTGFGEVGQALVASPGVDKIIFTGSPQVGKAVMAGAAPHLKPVILELGGKDPMVFCDDVDVREVMPMLMRGVYQNCGQNCCGIERVFVYEKIYNDFLELALKNVRGLRQGPVLGKQQVDCGAMVMPAQMDIIQGLVDDAVARGARLLVGGKRNAKLPDGLFYQPTILADVTADMRVAQEEVFGPVMCVIKVPGNSDATCISMVNDCNFGLGSAVYSKDVRRAEKLGQGLCCGMTTINDFGVNYLVQSLPFGGVKHSGFDRFAGPEGLRACCLMKSVVVDRFPGIKTTIPGLLQYPIAKSGLLFGQSLVRLMYGPTLWDRATGLFNMAKAALSK